MESQGGMVDIVPLLKALADKQRVKIAALIADRGLTVEELAGALGLPPSSVSQHLAVLKGAGLVEGTSSRGTTLYRFRLQPVHAALRAISGQSRPRDLEDDLDDFDQKVLNTFMEDGRLKSIPAQQKKRDVVLRYLADRFEQNRMYDEKEVNAILAKYHEDVASLRRYMVDTGLLERQIVRVVDAEALYEGTPQVDLRVMYWKPST